MGLFGRKFPYSNFHELNLDWIIETLKEIENTSVLSVNGMTGEVVLYQDPNVVFPEIESSNWTITRTAGGHEVGLQLQGNMLFLRYDGNTNQVYTHDSPPPYPVTSVDGMTGAVTTMPNAATRLPDVEEAYTNIRRQIGTGTADQAIVGIQVEKDKAYRMQDQQRLQLYDSANQPPYPVTSVNGRGGDVTGLYDASNPPPYPVTSVNGKTGVVTIAIPITELSQGDAVWIASQASPNNTAGLMRGTAAGPVSLWLDGSLDPVSGDHIAAYISWTDPTDDTNVITQKLLTNADIPQGAGVISINGLTGVVTLNASNVLYNTTDTIMDKFNSVDTILDNLAIDMAPAYSSSATYAVGDRVTYQGRIYVCTTAVTTPEAFNIDHWSVSQNMTYQINQINNRLITDESYINSLQNSLGIVLNGNTTSVAVAAGQYVIVENSTITGITDGLYTAASAWEAGFTVTAAYLTPVTNGGLNSLSSKISGLFNRHARGSFTPNRNTSTDIWTAPEDCIAYVALSLINTPNGGYVTLELSCNSTVISYIATPSLPANDRNHMSELSGIVNMKAGDVIKLTTNYSANSSPTTSYYNISY